MKTTFFNSILFVIIFSPFTGIAQYITVTGFVTSEKNGNYLENVNIYESVSTIGTLSDKNGFYHLMLPPGTIKLTATFDGFKDFSKQMTIKKDTVLTIKLKPVPDPKDIAKKEDVIQASKATSESNSKWRLFKF